MQELIERIRAICLEREVIEKPYRRIEINNLCEALLTFIHLPSELNAIIYQLPRIAGEIIRELHEAKRINNWVNFISSMPSLLNILVGHVEWQEQIIAASKIKLTRIVKTEDDLISVLEVLYTNPKAQEVLLVTLENDLTRLIKDGKKLGLVLAMLEFSSELKGRLIEAIEPKLNELLKSQQVLGSLLKNLCGKDERHLQKIIISEFAVNIKSWNNVKHTLRTLSEVSDWQEDLITALNSRLATLEDRNKKDKESILETLKDPILQTIVNTAFSEQKQTRSAFFGIGNPAYDGCLANSIFYSAGDSQLRSR